MMLVRPGDWMPQGITELEDRAWEALRETERSVCVTAGAGAGKTEFLAQKAAYLLQTGLCSAPKRILAISFKRDAAQTLAERVRQRVPEAQARRFVSSTFDAFTKGLLDQFRLALPTSYRPSSDYRVARSSRGDLEEFLERVDVRGINPRQLEQMIVGARLPIEEVDLPAEHHRALRVYWRDQYTREEQALLTFPMINRLADYLLRHNAQVRRVLRLTYPIVFLDEFQDTTMAQFELLFTAFDARRTTFTAVGDDKQRIMGWAGAMPNAFQGLIEACAAREVSLLMNWRSHEDLTAVQHLIAQRLSPAVEPVRARRSKAVDGQVSAIWAFGSREQEVQGLAGWIAREVESGLEPHRIALLVRSLAHDAERELAPAFAEHGLVLRNIARDVGEITIQDVLVEGYTELILPLLRLGATRKNPEAWSLANKRLGSLKSIDLDDEVGQRDVSNLVARLSMALRTYMLQHPPSEGAAVALIQTIVDELGEVEIRAAWPAYGRQADFARVVDGFAVLLQESTQDATSWTEVLNRFEGKAQLPLMTVHKSKGMEFHTMIFFGLNSASWRGLTPTSEEEMRSFFVAFTRAEQRAFFTYCEARGQPIAWLERLLGKAVPRIMGPNALADRN